MQVELWFLLPDCVLIHHAYIQVMAAAAACNNVGDSRCAAQRTEGDEFKPKLGLHGKAAKALPSEEKPVTGSTAWAFVLRLGRA